MSTTLEIITGAHRESNLIAIGVTPKTDQQTEGLSLLQELVSSVLGFEVGEQLNDWPIGTVNFDPIESAAWSEQRWTRPFVNSRLYVNVQSPQTIYFPVNPDNGARMAVVDVLGNLATYPMTLDGNGKHIEGAATVTINTNSANKEWMFRADLQNWVLVTPLANPGDMPFPQQHDGYFTTRLAMRLNPRYARKMDPQTLDTLQRAEQRIQAEYRQRIITPADLGVQVLSVQAYNAGLGYGGVFQPYPYGWMV